jgi:meso-butanediol dehydrogenase / (S,S)-butanediol dehydrogenase / diacetyl reductase
VDSQRQAHLSSRLDQVTCLITGAAGGIGRAIALRLVDEGASVVLCDVAQEPVESLASEIGGQALAVVADVTDEASMKAAVQQAVDRFGSLNVMYNNAGVARFTPIETITREAFDQVMGVNIYGVIVGSKVAAEVMRSQGRGGKIVNTCSVAGKRAGPRAALYAGSKFAVRGITQSLALELAADGITVNALCPGIVDTPLWEPLANAYKEHGLLDDTSKVLEMMSARIALGRHSEPSDTAGLAAFLASTDSDYMTGQCINIDGGMVFD